MSIVSIVIFVVVGYFVLKFIISLLAPDYTQVFNIIGSALNELESKINKLESRIDELESEIGLP
ncbi:hypothetical protein [Candidatus Endomicrobiellum agilis]|uniref:hypothetical protein n=1 Tax=Candidatus Endomicrobiellum agilis TaxID=3238957 RepID=UPI00357B9601|nr:hypothetical protein [Endomicrobium sp.]